MSGSDVRHCGLAQWRFLARKSRRIGGSIPGFQSWLIEPPRRFWKKMSTPRRSRRSLIESSTAFLVDYSFRLFSPRHDPWDATGAFRRGGRWNSRGTAILYAASSQSLACLEILVRIRNPDNFPAYAYSQIAIPEHQIERWESTDPIRSPERRKAIFESEVLSREEGDIWIRNGRPVPHKTYRPGETPEIENPYGFHLRLFGRYPRLLFLKNGNT